MSEGLGSAALAMAQAELIFGVREEPPHSNTGPRVREYLAGCVRHGHPLGLTAAEWCAAFVSWCVWQAFAIANGWGAEPRNAEHIERCARAFDAVRHPESPSIGYRAAVAELVTDARHTNAWHDVSELDADGNGPVPGDIIVLGRAGHDPRVGGEGHVAIVESGGAGVWEAIGGNQGNAVTAQARSVHDTVEPLVGWISMSTGPAPMAPREQ